MHYFILLVLLAMSVTYAAAQEAWSNSLALLIAVPWSGEMAMRHDIQAIIPVLRRRGLQAHQMMILDQGVLDRETLLVFLRQAHRRTQSWDAGAVFMYVSGHGTFAGRTLAEARPAVQLRAADHPTQEHTLYWDEIFAALDLPQGVTLTLLPDT